MGASTPRVLSPSRPGRRGSPRPVRVVNTCAPTGQRTHESDRLTIQFTPDEHAPLVSERMKAPSARREMDNAMAKIELDRIVDVSVVMPVSGMFAFAES